MKSKVFETLLKAAKVLAIVLVFLLGLKLFLSLAGAVTLGLTLFTLATWGIGTLVLVGFLIFLAKKVFPAKRRR